MRAFLKKYYPGSPKSTAQAQGQPIVVAMSPSSLNDSCNNSNVENLKRKYFGPPRVCFDVCLRLPPPGLHCPLPLPGLLSAHGARVYHFEFLHLTYGIPPTAYYVGRLLVCFGV